MLSSPLPTALAAIAALLAAAPAAAAPTVSRIGDLQEPAAGIAAGPDGAVWHTSKVRVGSTTVAGQTTEYELPQAGIKPGAIIAGPDGALWFADGQGAINRTTVAGVTSTVATVQDGTPVSLAAGPDGNVWFTVEGGKESSDGAVGRVTPGGTVTLFTQGLSAEPYDIAAGWDGALWFTETAGDRIGRITTTGDISEFKGVNGPRGIAAAPADQAMWFTERGAVGRIDGSGKVAEYDDGAPPGHTPGDMALGADGALWFTLRDSIGRVSTAGELATYTTDGMRPGAITLGPDNALWFTDSAGRTLGRIAEPAAQPPDGEAPGPGGTDTPAVQPPVAGQRFVAGVVRGTVRYRPPGQRRFKVLDEAASLPVGTVLNATHGRVRLTTALPGTGRGASAAATRTQTGEFYGGRFQMIQSRHGSGLVRLALRGRLSCANRAVTSSSKPRKKRRRLWSVVKGLFGTLGLDSVATVRGTKWLTEDRCGGTLTVVRRGTVVVRSRATGRRYVVHAGERRFVRHGR